MILEEDKIINAIVKYGKPIIKCSPTVVSGGVVINEPVQGLRDWFPEMTRLELYCGGEDYDELEELVNDTLELMEEL